MGVETALWCSENTASHLRMSVSVDTLIVREPYKHVHRQPAEGLDCEREAGRRCERKLQLEGRERGDGSKRCLILKQTPFFPAKEDTGTHLHEVGGLSGNHVLVLIS